MEYYETLEQFEKRIETEKALTRLLLQAEDLKTEEEISKLYQKIKLIFNN